MHAPNGFTAADAIVSTVTSVSASSCQQASARALLTQIKAGYWQAQIAQVRDAFAAHGKEAADALKVTLPAVLFSGRFTRRKATGLAQHSGLICADLDDLGGNATALRNQLKNDPHCLAAFLSPTGTGLKAVFVCDPAKPHAESWQAVAEHCATCYGVTVDPATKDVARACFVSHDPEAFIAPGQPQPVAYSAASNAASASSASAHVALTENQIRELLSYVSKRPPYEEWIKLIGAVASAVPMENGIALLKERLPEETPGEYAEKWAHALDHVSPGTLFYYAQQNGWKPSPAFKQAVPEHLIASLATDALRERIAAREWGVMPEPTKPIPRFSVAGVPISTPGNLTSIFAQAKTGKSSLIAAQIAAAIVAEFVIEGRDCLSVTAAEPAGRALLHIDTEQSTYDHFQLIKRALQRAGIEECPAWLRSFGLAGYGPKELVAVVRILAEEEAAKNGIFAIVIDGIADLVSDVNAADECNALIAELHDIAIRHDCPILCVVHENPAQTTGKQRGHLGSQLERKAETNLRLKKDGETTVVYAEKTRGAPILEKFGPRFQWDEEAGMHVSVSTAATAVEDAKTAELRELAEECITDDAISYSELRQRVAAARGWGLKTAEKRIGAMAKAGVIRKATGSNHYLLSN